MLSENGLKRRRFLSILPTLPMAIFSNSKPTKKANFYNPKFNIGDYVECRFETGEDPDYYERGQVDSITLQSDGTWEYSFVISECAHPSLVGLPTQADEGELTLLNWEFGS